MPSPSSFGAFTMLRTHLESLSTRISLLLFLALVSIGSITGLFWVFSSHTADLPRYFDDLGKQRMLSMQMVATAHQFSHQPDAARETLEDSIDHFEGTLNELCDEIITSQLGSPQLIEEHHQLQEQWHGFQAPLRTLLDPDATPDEYRQAQDYLIVNGPLMADGADQLIEALHLQVDHLRQRQLWLMIAAVIFNLLLLLVGYALSRRHIVHPLQRLNEGAKRLRVGDLKARVPHRHSGEIGDLEQTFNRTASTLENLIHSLQEERQFAKTLIAHVPAAVLVHRDEAILFANHCFFALIHQDPSTDLSLQECIDYFHPGDQDRARRALTTIPADSSHSSPTDPPPTTQLRVHAGDDQRTIELVSVPVEYGGSNTILTVLSDVTRRQELTARMMQMDRVIAIGTLVAGVGHEINNPLGFLVSNLQFSLRRLQALRDPGDEPSSEQLDAIESAMDDALVGAQRIRDIVKQLRSFTTDDSVDFQALDIRRPLESALRMAQGEIRHRARLITDFDDVPPVLANESKLAQVFLNLLINAAHAIEAGSADDDTITVRIFSDDDSVVTTIEDTGMGIVADKADRVFDPFFTTKPPGQGTGLGLSICQSIIESHQGFIGFDSTPGEGTCFRIELPATGASHRPRPSGRPAVERAIPKTIAVIDDEVLIGELFRRTLGEIHEIHVMTDPHRFLAALEEGCDYDLIFCDLMMPSLTGMDLYHILARDHPQTIERLIFITGGAFVPEAREFLDEVDPPLLPKPFSVAELEAVIAQPAP